MELTRLAAEAAAFLLNVSLRSLLLFFAAGLVLLFLRRASAAGRHLLWAMTMGSLLLLPVLNTWLPRWDAPVLPSRTTASSKTIASLKTTKSPQAAANVQHLPNDTLQKPLLTLPDDAQGSLPSAQLGNPPASPEKADAEYQGTSMPHRLASQISVPVTDPQASRSTPLHSQPFAPTKSVSSSSVSAPAWGGSGAEWLVGLWLVGVLIALCRTAFSLLAARRLLRGSSLITEGALVEAAMEASGTLSLSTPMILKTGTAALPVAVPMTFGTLRPVVLMPMEAASWPDERLRVVLLHEAAHVKRLDWMTTMLTQVVLALYWFHPLVWLASRRLRVESEQACDDLVLSSGVEAVEYADHLVEVVRGLAGRRVSGAVVTMAYSQEVTGRLKTILAGSKNRSEVTGRGLALATVAALTLVLPLAAMHPMANHPAAKLRPLSEVRQENAATQPNVPQNLGALMSSPLRLVSLMAGKSPWERRLPDGTRVRLLFVGAQNAQYNIVSSWTPDGVLLQPGDTAMSLPSIYGKHYYQFVYGVVFPSAKRQKTAVLSFSNEGESSGITSGAGRWHNGDAEWENFPTLFPKEQTKGNVVVNVAAGPETTLIAASPRTGATRLLPTGEAITVTKAHVVTFPSQHQPTKTTEVVVILPTRFVRDMSEYHFAPIGRDDKPIDVQHSGANVPDTSRKMVHMNFDFRTSELPMDQVKEFRFTYRPAQAALFRNVALQPIRSSVQVPSQFMQPRVQADDNGAPSAAPKPFNFDQTTWAQTAGDAGLKLVAVSDKPANTKRWWRPDGTPFSYNWHQFHVNFEPQNPHVPHAFVQQSPVLIFRSGHPSTSDFSISGWRDPQAFRPNGHVALAEYICLDQNGTSYFGFTPLLASNSRSISVRLRVEAGPWQVQDTREQEYTPERLAKGILQMNGSSAAASWKISRVSSTRTKFRLQQPKGISGKQVRLVALDGQGREYAPEPGTTVDSDQSSGAVTNYTLEVPLSRIRKFLVEVRPFYYRDFYGIARQPVSVARHASPVPLAPVALASTQSREDAKKERVASAANLHLIGLALFQYAYVHEEHLPDAKAWMQEIIPYLVPKAITGTARQQRIAALFHDPASPPDQTWSYAYNRALSGLSLSKIDAPNQTVAVFESRQSIWNNSDNGQSIPQPGRHSGGSDYLFADGHTKWFRTLPPLTGFNPRDPAAHPEIPIQGRIYDRRTHKPLSGTFVIFSKSPQKVTSGSVWPSSFTNKAGHFQSFVYPGKNYLMVLVNNHFTVISRTLNAEASGNTGKLTIQRTRIGSPGSPASDYTMHLALPRTYALKMSSASNIDRGTDIISFMPVARSASR